MKRWEVTVSALGLTAAAAGGYFVWRHRYDGIGDGYVDGQPVRLRLVTVDGKPVEVATAAAFELMRAAARSSGVSLRIVSAFRTLAEQEYFYNCYRTGTCNRGHFAAKPGYSSHQSGRALDLNARTSGVYEWLRKYAGDFAFFETVENEPWHWEYQPEKEVAT